MDLLKSLIVPAAFPSTPTHVPSGDSQHSHCTATPSGLISAEYSPLLSLTGEAAHQTEQQESASALKKKRKKTKKKQKQTPPEQNTVAAVPVLSTPAAVTKAKKRKQSHLSHPNRPKSGTNKRSILSYEDLYDDISEQNPILPTPDSYNSNSNLDATQTCFFWYHGSCRRSLDRRGCQLRHALLDPPSKVVAPPRFFHPKPCELQWCAGDGATRRGHKAESAVGQKRYFEVDVSDDDSTHEGTNEDGGDKSEYFPDGFVEPGA
jgi:hypothetical protein